MSATRLARVTIEGKVFQNLNTLIHYQFVDEKGDPVGDVLPAVSTSEAKELMVTRELVELTELNVATSGYKRELIPGCKYYDLVKRMTGALRAKIEQYQRNPKIHYIVVDRDVTEVLDQARPMMSVDKILYPVPVDLNRHRFLLPRVGQLIRSCTGNQLMAAHPLHYNLKKFKFGT